MSAGDLSTRIAPDYLGRLSERTQERLAHPTSIGEARFAGDEANRMTASFHHESRSLHAQILHRFRRGLTRFRAEGAAKLSGTQIRGLREPFNGELRMEIAFRIR
jgi:hypothetical protein